VPAKHGGIGKGGIEDVATRGETKERKVLRGKKIELSGGLLKKTRALGGLSKKGQPFAIGRRNSLDRSGGEVSVFDFPPNGPAWNIFLNATGLLKG